MEVGFQVLSMDLIVPETMTDGSVGVQGTLHWIEQRDSTKSAETRLQRGHWYRRGP